MENRLNKIRNLFKEVLEKYLNTLIDLDIGFGTYHENIDCYVDIHEEYLEKMDKFLYGK